MNDREVLIGRIVDREAGPTDWARFDDLALTDDRATPSLLVAMRDDAMLRAVLGEAVSIADGVDLRPLPLVRMRALVHWGGWVAAAVLALVWMATDMASRRAPQLAPQHAREIVRSAPSDVPSAERITAEPASEVVRELPNVMMETRPIPGSDRVEIVYLRRAIERAIVSDAYTVGRDETGQPVEVRADLTRFATKRSY